MLTDPRVGAFDGTAHLRTVAAFAAADRDHIGSTAVRVRRAVAENATRARDAYPRESDVIEHQARLKRGHLPIRQLFQAAPHVLGALRPCWAMSPLVVAQLLPLGRWFDVVIFDEASQITPADAMGALMRADRAVVAGDPHQLPPTSFFASSADAEEDDEAETPGLLAGTRNMECNRSSTLWECSSRPRRERARWAGITGPGTNGSSRFPTPSQTFTAGLSPRFPVSPARSASRTWRSRSGPAASARRTPSQTRWRASPDWSRSTPGAVRTCRSA